MREVAGSCSRSRTRAGSCGWATTSTTWAAAGRFFDWALPPLRWMALASPGASSTCGTWRRPFTTQPSSTPPVNRSRRATSTGRSPVPASWATTSCSVRVRRGPRGARVVPVEQSCPVVAGGDALRLACGLRRVTRGPVADGLRPLGQRPPALARPGQRCSPARVAGAGDRLLGLVDHLGPDVHRPGPAGSRRARSSVRTHTDGRQVTVIHWDA